MIRQLRAGEPVPSHEPRRYRAGHGYIRLRWRVGPRAYVEAYEHRVFDGYVTTAEHVHHRNRKRDDNDRSNLLPLTADEHAAEHLAEARAREARAASLYRSGLTTTQIADELGVGAPCISRALGRAGVQTRNSSDYARPVDLGEVIHRYTTGQGFTGIAKDLGVSPERVRSLLVGAGVTLRGPGRVPRQVTR